MTTSPIDVWDSSKLDVLRAYSAGRLGTRDAIKHAGLRDYADLIIGLAQNDLAFPRPAATPSRAANVAMARSLLQPRLRRPPHG